MTVTPRGDGPALLPDRVTMPLLVLVTRDAVDEDYVHAARRRAAAADRPPDTQRTPLRGAAVVTVLFGLLIALAAVQTARNAGVREASRDALIARIDERRADVSSLRDRIASLKDQNDDLQSANSRAQGQLAETTVRQLQLEVGTGFVTVHGPGLRITVSDSPSGSADGRVRASDLRLLVNGLWRAGAEAIAVNGRRLSGMSAIANSNIAIQVNHSPLTPPYIVSAIGPSTMAGRLRTTSSGVQFQALADQFGFVVDPHNESELVLPAAPDAQLQQLRYAEQGSGPPDKQEELP